MKFKSNEEILNFCAKYAQPLDIRVAEVEVKQGKNPSITIFIDKDGGVDLDTCALFHNTIFLPLDELDPSFDAPYTLNVSSLGIDRPFKTDEDFISHIGKMVEVKLKDSIRGKKFYDGVLKNYDGKSVVLTVNKSTEFTIDLKNIVKMNEYIDY